METSMLKTLASKHRSTVSKMAARYKAKVVWVAAEMRAGSAFAHSTVALHTLGETRQPHTAM
jgi:hypothetical protein